MKKIKQGLSIFLALLMLFMLASCGTGKNKGGDVEQIQIETEDAAIRYVGYEYVPQEVFPLGVGDREKTIFVKFEYTNKRNEPINFRSDFSLSVTQNGEVLNTLKAFNSEADITAIMNYLNGTATNETLSVHYPIIMKDYSPLTVTVSTVSGKETIVQNMNLEVEAPEGVIVPGDSAVEPSELVAEWLNINNGDKLVIKEGKINPTTNIVEGSADDTPADDTLRKRYPIHDYELEGDIIKLGDERFRVTKENDKLYFKGLDSDTTYMRRSDFYKFEDVKVHQLNEMISTDAVEFTLNAFGYANEVNPYDLGEKVSLFHEEMLVPDNGMIWADVSYSLFNKSNNDIDLSHYETNVRFSLVYQNNYTFEMTSNPYITKGNGGEDHVECLGGEFNVGAGLHLPALAREDFETWFAVAPAVRDDKSAKLHILVLLPKTGGTELFVYEVKN